MMLFVRDVAASRRVSTSSARQWLCALEKEHGREIVGRLGKRLFTTDAALAKVVPGWAANDDRASHRLADRIGVVWRRVTELTRVVRALEERLREIASIVEELGGRRVVWLLESDIDIRGSASKSGHLRRSASPVIAGNRQQAPHG
jgi:hypothetical protein